MSIDRQSASNSGKKAAQKRYGIYAQPYTDVKRKYSWLCGYIQECQRQRWALPVGFAHQQRKLRKVCFNMRQVADKDKWEVRELPTYAVHIPVEERGHETYL